MSVITIEAALRTWVKSVTGFDDGHVFFNDQKVTRPTGPYVTLKISSIEEIDALTEVDYLTDLTRPAGQEIEARVTVQCQVTVSVQVWGAVVTSASVLSALALGLKLQLGLELPSVRSALDEAGVSPHDWGPVQNLATLLGTEFDGRSSFDLFLYVAESISEFTTYIQSVQLGNSIDNTTDTVQS